MKEYIAITRNNLSFIALAVAIASLPFSVKVCHGAILFVLLSWATEGRWHEKLAIFKRSILLHFIVAYCLMHIIGLLYSENLTAGWFELEKKIFLFTLPIALATTSVKFTQKQLYQLLSVFVTACFIGSLVCIAHAVNNIYLFTQENAGTNNIHYLSSTNFNTLNPAVSEGWFLASYVALADGIKIHPAYFSLYLSFCTFFILYRLQDSSLARLHKILFWFLVMYFSLFIVCLSSRIIILSTLLIVSVLLLYRVLWLKSKTNTIILATIISLCLLVLFGNPISRYRNIQEVTTSSYQIEPHTEYKTSIMIRASLWWLALHAFTSVNPIWGCGTGDATELMIQTSQKYAITNSIGANEPHNQYLFTLLSHGVLGLLLLILMFITPLYIAWQQQDYLYIIFSFLFAALCLTESALELQKGILFYALFFSLLAFKFNSYHVYSLSTTKPIADAK